MSDQLYLIDASIYVFRAWHSLPDSLTDGQGNPVNAVYGFGGFLTRLLTEARPSHAAVLFDESLTSSFRNRLLPAYKANRALPPENLERQFKLCRRLSRAAGLTTFASRRYEADDLIGTLARRLRPKRFSMVYVSRDKDLLQLLQDGDEYWDFAADRRIGAGQVCDVLGVDAHHVVDLLALTGDAIDNVPGVPGVGAKTAAALLRHFGDLEGIYQHLDALSDAGIRGAARTAQALQAHRQQVMLARRVLRIHCDVPLKVSAGDLRWRGVRSKAMSRLCNELGFGSGFRQRFAALEGSE